MLNCNRLKKFLTSCFVFDFIVKYLDFLRKRTNTKPSRGPFHFRAPSRIVWRTVRGKYFIFLVGVIFAVWLITVLKSLKNAVDPLI